MAKYSKLTIGKKVEIEILDGEYKGRYKSKVTNINNEEIYLMPIFEDGEVIKLNEELSVRILYKGKDAFYKFNSKVLRMIQGPPLNQIVIEHSKELKRIQRRRYFRQKINKEIDYKRITHKKLDDDKKFNNATMLNLSGGGLLMILKEDLKVNDILSIHLNIKDLDYSLKGRVVRIEYEEDDDKKYVGIEFFDINMRTRDIIISFLLDYQRKLRKKGLI